MQDFHFPDFGTCSQVDFITVEQRNPVDFDYFLIWNEHLDILLEKDIEVISYAFQIYA